MKSCVVASAYLPNPDEQIWQILIPNPEQQEAPKHFEDDAEAVIERGED